MALVTPEQQRLFSLFGYGPAQVQGMSQVTADAQLAFIMRESAPELLVTISAGESKTAAEEFTAAVEQAKAAPVTTAEAVDWAKISAVTGELAAEIERTPAVILVAVVVLVVLLLR